MGLDFVEPLPTTEKLTSWGVCEAHQLCALRKDDILEEIEGYKLTGMFELATRPPAT